MYCSRCGSQTETNAAFCHRCGSPLFGYIYPTHKAAQPKRNGILIAGAVLCLVSGGIGILVGFFLVLGGLYYMYTDFSYDLSVTGFEEMIGATYLTIGIIAIVFSVLAIFGGIKTLKKSSFGWAIVGSIGAVFASFWLVMIPGIVACIFIIMSRKEFYNKPEQPETGVEQNNVIH
ncbi:MAG: zinc ribbon domain-containing protein [Chloroflexi bacterium]|nr:zinc ribbon domain-containing protein [Chloroflexota bacterium]MBT7080791.1 zinc ribbon domain-containing protein [Chloroflexota bacterium]MBT7289307.1 zinc ribbon domain-containing protein [Chloroflexota bacterium]